MSDRPVDQLRAELRSLGYLSHGLERWFALDPWSSRTFWYELSLVAAKAAALLGTLAALSMLAVMAIRNQLNAIEIAVIGALYLAGMFVLTFIIVVVLALFLRLRVTLAIERPRVLTFLSLGGGACLVAVVAYWWFRFPQPSSAMELAVGTALLLVTEAMAVIVLSAALLSFSIYETGQIPQVHQASRFMPIAAAVVTIAVLIMIVFFRQADRDAVEQPQLVVVTPSQKRVAFIGVDGLTQEILASRRDTTMFRSVVPAAAPAVTSSAERWATIGTGTPNDRHRVRAIEGVRITGDDRVLQSVSRADFLLGIAGLAGLADRVPLPPTVRKRDYVWEVFAARGTKSAAVNWWVTSEAQTPALSSIPQSAIFAAASKASPAEAALAIDARSGEHLLRIVSEARPQFVTAYLPALDIVLNRIEIDAGAKIARSVQILDGALRLASHLRQAGYEVILAGAPGDSQQGSAVLATTFEIRKRDSSLYDLAPTICNLLGYPATDEMPGRSLLPDTPQQRIATYGNRETLATTTRVDEEYYESLRSLGYVQ